MLNDTDGVWGGTNVAEYKGNNIDGATGTSSTTTQKSTVTHTKGYDKDKPFQGFFRIRVQNISAGIFHFHRKISKLIRT